jgi:hypothetical protein
VDVDIAEAEDVIAAAVAKVSDRACTGGRE